MLVAASLFEASVLDLSWDALRHDMLAASSLDGPFVIPASLARSSPSSFNARFRFFAYRLCSLFPVYRGRRISGFFFKKTSFCYYYFLKIQTDLGTPLTAQQTRECLTKMYSDFKPLVLFHTWLLLA